MAVPVRSSAKCELNHFALIHILGLTDSLLFLWWVLANETFTVLKWTVLLVNVVWLFCMYIYRFNTFICETAFQMSKLMYTHTFYDFKLYIEHSSNSFADTPTKWIWANYVLFIYLFNLYSIIFIILFYFSIIKVPHRIYRTVLIYQSPFSSCYALCLLTHHHFLKSFQSFGSSYTLSSVTRTK